MTVEQMLRLTEMLPSNARSFQARAHEPRQRPPNVFNSGAFVHGPAVGVMGHPKQHKYTFTLMATIVTSFAPEHLYSSASLTLNTQSARHRDMHNLAGRQKTWWFFWHILKMDSYGVNVLESIY